MGASDWLTDQGQARPNYQQPEIVSAHNWHLD
jgi:hypothetical protein